MRLTSLLAVLMTALSCGGDPRPSPEEIRSLINKSDDFERYQDTFVSATTKALNDETCTLDDLKEDGVWIRSQKNKKKPTPIYFMNCGTRKVYTNVTSGETQGTNINLATEAFVMCQDPIRAQLKAPRSAKFPYFSSPGVRVGYTGVGEYAVSGFVDAQNSFGAGLRVNWTCHVKRNTDGTWRLVKAAIDG